MATIQNAPRRGNTGPDRIDANGLINRLGGPRVAIVLVVVLVIGVVAVTSIMSGIADTNQQTEQRAVERKQEADDEARAERKKEKEQRHQQEAQDATVVHIDDITDENLHTDVLTYADEDGDISQKEADKVSSVDIESFDSLPQLAPFKNISSLSVGDYNRENYDIGSISTIWSFSIGDCSVSNIDATRFSKLQWLCINRLESSVDTLNAKNMPSLTKLDLEGLQGHIGTVDLSGATGLERIIIRTKVGTVNLCGTGSKVEPGHINVDFAQNSVGKILYDSKTNSDLVEFLQSKSSDWGFTMEQQ